MTSFAYFDILNLRLTERNYPAKSSQGKKKESQKKKGKDNEKKTYLRRCAHYVRDNVPLLRLQVEEERRRHNCPPQRAARQSMQSPMRAPNPHPKRRLSPRRKSPLPTPSEGLQTSQEIPVMSTPPLPRSESPSGKRTENIPAARTSRQANTM